MKLLVLWTVVVFSGQANSDCLDKLKNYLSFGEIIAKDDIVVHTYTDDLSDIEINSLDNYAIFSKNEHGADVLILKNMEKFHEEEKESNEALKRHDFTIDAKCKDKNSLRETLAFIIRFADDRIYPPYFIDDSGQKITEVEIELPLPFPKLPLNLFKSIRAKDIDMYNKKLNFIIEPTTGFEVTESNPDSKNKIYEAVITPMQGITEATTFKITVEDEHSSGDPPESALLTVSIKKNPTESITSFDKLYYEGNFDVENLKLTINSLIVINSNDAKIDLEGEYSQCFKASNEIGNVEVDPSSCPNLPYQEDQIQIHIIAKSDADIEIASSLLTLEVSRKSFEKNVYTHQDGSPLTDIKLFNAREEIKLELDPKLPDFECNIVDPTKEPKIITCSIPNDLQNHNQFQLAAYYGDNPVDSKITTEIIIIGNSVEDTIKFSELYYQGKFDVENLKLTINSPIDINSNNAKIDLEGDYSQCFKATNENGNVKVDPSPCPNLPYQEDQIQIHIIAKSDAGTKIASSLLTLEVSRKSFEKTVYTHQDGSTLTDIKLLNARKEIKLELDPKLPDFECNIVDSTKEPKIITCSIPNDLQNHNQFQLAAYYDENPVDSKITTEIIIIGNSVVEDTIKFSEVHYQGTFDNDKQEITKDPTIKLISSSGDYSNIQVSIDEKFDGMFKPQLTATGDINLIVETANFEEAVITFVITASTPNLNSVQATVSLDITHENSGGEEKIEFSKEVYMGKLYANTLSISHEEISFTTDLPDVKISIDPEDERFKVSTNDKKVTLAIEDNSLFPTEETMVSLIITAKADGASGYTIISLEVIQPTVDNSLLFLPYTVAHSFVDTEIDNEEVIQFHTNSEDPTDIEFSISADIPEVKIGESDGILTISKGIEPKVHEYIVTARSKQTGRKVEGPIVLVIRKEVKEDVITADFSHVVVSIKEDQTNEQLVLGSPEIAGLEYGYCIESCSPDIEDMFGVNDKGNIMAKRLLREAKYFDNMDVPQFTLVVQLMKIGEIPDDGKCKSEPANRQKRDIIEGIVMQQRNTPTDPLKTTISVLIEDINNNPPIIDENKLVGYPNKELSAIVKPTYLTKIHATDKDTLETGFGKITYVPMETSKDFIQVNPIGGEVYPTTAMFDDTIMEFEVKAYDENNLNDPAHFSVAHISVKLLDQSHLATMEVEEKVEDIDEFLKGLASEDIVIKALSIEGFYNNAPSTVGNRANRSVKSETPKRKTKIIVYGFKEQSPMSFEDLQKFFADNGKIIVSDFNASDIIQKEDHDETGYIVAVSILSVLLVGVIVGFIIWYRRSKRNVPYQSQVDKIDSSQLSIKNEKKLSFNSEKSIKSDEDNNSITHEVPGEENENRSSIGFVKNPHRTSGTPQKENRRPTGYVINPFREVDELSDLPAYDKQDEDKKGKGDELESILSDTTMDTVKSVKFNNDVIHSELYEDSSPNDIPDVSD